MVSTTPQSVSPAPEDTEPVDPDHRSYQTMSVKGPALIVLGIAVFIVVIGSVAAVFGSGGSPTFSLHTVTADGSVIHLTPATTAMSSIVNGGQPPADILGNLAVPTGSPVVRTINSDQDAGQFDRTVAFTTGLSADNVIATYKTMLPKLGWTVIFTGAHLGGQGTEVLAKRGSGDGYYWEVGVVVSPTTSAGTTPFTVEVFELPDDS